MKPHNTPTTPAGPANNSHPTNHPHRPRAMQAATPDRCLSIAEPWAYLIAAGFKQIENRTWHTAYRGTIAIHASKSRHAFDDDDMMAQLCSYDAMYDAFDDKRISDDVPLFAAGAIIGTADILDVVEFAGYDPTADDATNNAAAAAAFDRYNHVAAQHSPAGNSIPVHMWAMGPYCWIFSNPRRFARVIPCTGKLSLWSLSPELRAAVAEASRHCLTDPGQPADMRADADADPAKAKEAAATEKRKAAAAAKKRERLLGTDRTARKSI